MKAKIVYILILVVIYSLQLNFAQEEVKSRIWTNNLPAEAISDEVDSPCPVGAPTNVSPPDGAWGLPLDGNTLVWINGIGTVSNEVWFGPSGNVVKVYDGSAKTSHSLPTLNDLTTYQWYIICKDSICGTNGPTWSFVTRPMIGVTVDIYPQNVNYWTGTCSPSAKTQISLVKGVGTEVGWMVFDLNFIVNDPSTVIYSIDFYGYLYSNSWPYWSITPMGSINPVTATAEEINNQVSNNYQQGTAYSYNQESGTLTNGWIIRPLETTATTDMKNAIGQRWFAIGFTDWDFSASFYVEFQGWAEANKPYLRVKYYYQIPVELISFTAEVDNNIVTLSWQTATETNNQGFEILRFAQNDNNQWEKIGFVEGKGTTTEIQSYSFTDKPEPGKYKYRLKQIDFDGTFAYSPEVEAEIKAPNVFSLEQNYPNPFNPSTKIKYTIPASSLNPFSKVEGTFVTLKVYDILGNEVAILVNEEQAPGTYEIEFNVAQVSRPGITSGIYFYQMKAGSFVETKKMILLK